MIEFVIVFCFSLIGTIYIIPHSIRKLREFGFLAKDMYKSNLPKIPTNAGIILLFITYVSISIFPIMSRIINYSLDFELFTNLTQTHLALVLVVSIYSIYGLVDDLVDTTRLMKLYLPITFSFPLMSVLHPENMEIPFFGSIDLTQDFIEGISYSDIIRFLLVPTYVMVVANLINMHSGYNGLQSGLSLILITTLIIKSQLENKLDSILPVAAFAGSLFIFWFYNYYPAKLFEGNIGSMIYGSLIGSVIVIQEFWWFGFVILIPHTFNFFLWIFWVIMIKKNPKEYLQSDGKHRKFGFVNEDGTLTVPNRLTLKWIPNYYFNITEAQSTLICYSVTVFFCFLSLILL